MDSQIILEPTLEKLDAWDKRDALRREKEMLGFYLSGNPLEEYYDDFKTATYKGALRKCKSECDNNEN